MGAVTGASLGLWCCSVGDLGGNENAVPRRAVIDALSLVAARYRGMKMPENPRFRGRCGGSVSFTGSGASGERSTGRPFAL